MLQIIQRTTISLFLLLLMPISVSLSGWTWQPGKSNKILHLMFWITQTISFPWGMLTSLLLSAWILWLLRFNLLHTFFLIIIMNSTILIGQLSQIYIKKYINLPRPYVMWLQNKYGIKKDRFYHLNRQERSRMVCTLLNNTFEISPWLKKHWALETDCSFPSGHTIFATTWTMLIVSLRWLRRHIRIMIVMLFIWTIMVMSSRLLLGMHWPCDLIAAILMSWLLVNIVLCLVNHFYKFLTIAN